MHYKGLALFELHKYEEAIEYYDEALEIHPGNKEILKHKELLMTMLKYGPLANGYSFVTKWGSNGTADGQFISPDGIAVDSSGNVYVTDMVKLPCSKV